ncbi:lipopolysaccharide biosynthesis protein [Hymenobacter caeli]|uniref:O-antigen/teichoic acid export membrane protein n=1 Tax=Hymenobacter caeli TaxID=2735894 RepID=A0ABX2FP23_9BACT|nr:lipopolysaccharide biosynthesis protein [Hymenobacter caeli]NRT18746.1 O-antigen/teichoic acid export membrane protein [Hymenobacter caeli]
MAVTTQNLTSAAVRGVQWTTAATVLTAVMQIGYTAVMARLLDPTAFGLVAMTGVVLRFGSYFAEMGLGHALVQRAEIDGHDVRAAFTASLGLGLAVAGLAWLGAPLAVLFLKEPAVVPLVRVQALGFVLVGLGATATSLLRREMRFEALAKVEVSAYVLGYGGVGITLAVLHAGVWSLIGASLAQQFFVAFFNYLVVRHSVRFTFLRAPYGRLLGYGGRVSVVGFLEFVNGNLDTLLIGRLLGSVLLGIYNRAYMLLYLPMYFLTNSLARVAFPAFSKIQDDLPRTRALYLASSTVVATLVLPLCAGVAVAAPELVQVLLGPRWAASVPVLRVLCLSIPLSMTTLFAGVVADARANLRQKIILNLEFMALLTALFWLLKGYGLAGIAGAIGTGEVVRTFLYMRVTHRDIGISYPRLLAIYRPGLLNAAAVGLALLAVALLVRPLHAPALLALLAQMAAGAAVLGAVLLRWPTAELRPVLRQALARLRGRAALPAGAQVRLARYAAFLERAAGGSAVLEAFDNPLTP